MNMYSNNSKFGGNNNSTKYSDNLNKYLSQQNYGSEDYNYYSQ
jgi:hypothetical protein